MGYDTQQGLTMGATGAATGAAVGGPIGAAVGGAAGLAMGFLPGKKGPDYGYLDNIYNERKSQIGAFGVQLANTRASYLSSLNNMYNSAFARFSGNAEAGFANRGLAVNGGAFASALARQTSMYQSQLEPQVYEAERGDIKYLNDSYGQAANMYVGGRSGGAVAAYNGNREDMQNMGSFAGKLALQYAQSRHYGSGGGPNGYGVENPGAYPRNSFRGNPLDARD